MARKCGYLYRLFLYLLLQERLGEVKALDREFHFEKIQFQMQGCDLYSDITGQIECAVTCANKVACSSYAFSTSTCHICEGDRISDVTFLPNVFFSLQGHACYDPNVHTLETLPISEESKLKPGTLVRMSFTPAVVSDGAIFDFYNQGRTEDLFHFSIRVPQTLVIMNSYFGAWNGEDYIDLTAFFPFASGKRTDIHLLLTKERFKIYIDKVYIGIFVYRKPLNEIYSLTLTMPAELHMICY